ncbi:MAG TPA: HDOD domain-containing protein [Steroidobacteraceae bacterium]|nr:HDOD domain-containing protein [Steroidobacteraceae bacterium]
MMQASVTDLLWLLVPVGAILGGYFVLRRRRLPATAGAERSPAPSAVAAATPVVAAADPEAAEPGLHEALAAASHQLWNRSFSASGTTRRFDAAHTRVLNDVEALIAGGTISPQHLPRRPALMPQLQAAVNDPDAGPRRLSDIIAQDPVLAVDVLRLANSALFRTSGTPVETIQRAIIVCGTDGLQSLLAAALMHPVFRLGQGATQFPVLLWERSTRAAMAAEMLALRAGGNERFTAQLLTLLSALGPLVVYRMVVERYQQARTLVPEPDLFVTLIEKHGAALSQQIARQWQSPPRLVAALGEDSGEPLSNLLQRAELLATISLLQRDDGVDIDTGPLAKEVAAPILERLRRSTATTGSAA